MDRDDRLCCPVCRAAFRGTHTCSRCGADLGRLMRLAAAAYRLRDAARQALKNGEHARARALLDEAESLCTTAQGRRLVLLAAWLEPPGPTPKPR